MKVFANRYVFVGGDPINNADRSGNISIDAVVRLIKAVVGLGDIYQVLTSESLLSYATAEIFGAACESGLASLSAGTALLFATIGCALASYRIGVVVDNALG